MADRIRVQVQEIGTLEIVLAVAEALEATGQAAWQDAGAIGSDDIACATEYLQVCHEAAEGLRKVIARLERRVQRHLDGPCEAH